MKLPQEKLLQIGITHIFAHMNYRLHLHHHELTKPVSDDVLCS